MQTKIETELLVIGYGNSLRRDDGVGPRVAEAIEALQLPGVRTLVCQLLTPEFADPIARARRVIFVDAAVDKTDGVHFRKLKPSAISQLMALTRDVYGHVPEACWLTIPAIHLGFGTDYSPETKAGFHTSIAEIKNWFLPISVRTTRPRSSKFCRAVNPTDTGNAARKTNQPEIPPENRRSRRGARRRLSSVRFPARGGIKAHRLGEQFAAGRFHRGRGQPFRAGKNPVPSGGGKAAA